MAWDPRRAGPPAWPNQPPASPPVPLTPPAPIWPGPPSPDATSAGQPLPPAPLLPPGQPLGPFHEAYDPRPSPLALPAPAVDTRPQAPTRHSGLVRASLGLGGGLASFFRHFWPSQTAAPDWGPTSLGLSAPLAAFLAYLGWWFTGVIIYFNERQNRYVRFHAFQSIVFTGLLSIVSVLAYVVASLCNDVFVVSHQLVFQTLSRATAAGALLAVIFAWFIPLIAAATGFKLRIPFIAPYAERYAQPFADDPPGTGDSPEG